MRRIAAIFAGLLFAAWPVIGSALEDVKALTLQSAAVATGNGTELDVANYSSVALLVTIADTATVTFEGSEDGSTWASKVCTSVANTSGTLVTTASATGTYQCSVAGLAKLRARVSSWTAGAVTVHARATTADIGGGGGGGGGGTEFAEDTAHVSGDNGTQILCVRRDANTTLADTTGDYAPCQVDSSGSLKVAIISGGGTGGTSLNEDAAHASGEAVTPIACRRIDTAATSAGTSGDWATVDCDANGALRVRIDSSAVGSSADVSGLEDAAEADGMGLSMMGAVRRDTAASSSGTSGDKSTVNVDQLGRLWTREGNPCADYARITSAAINESTAATNEIVALTASNLIYVCSYKFITTAANSLSWSYGTGTDCNTGTTAIEGPQPYAANGGVAESGGGFPLFVVPSGNALCLVSSAATAHGGRISYVKTAAP